MLSAGDRASTFPWSKLATVVVAAWLTMTTFLYLVLTSGGSPFRMTEGDSARPFFGHYPPVQQPLRRTAHEKFLAWAAAHKPTERTPSLISNWQASPADSVEAVTPSLRKPASKQKLGEDSQAMPHKVEDDGAVGMRRKMTAHEKLEAYAHKALPRLSFGASKQEGRTGTTQRQRFEAEYPPSDTERVRSFVNSLRTSTLDDGIRESVASHKLPYDPFDCPDSPPADYPLHYSLVDMLQEWPVDELQWPTFDLANDHSTTTHPYLYQSLCIFDWDRTDHRERMRRYQVEFDVPFVLRNHPEFMKTSERWMRPSSGAKNYLQTLIGDETQRTEHSFHSNHLPFWRTAGIRKLPGDWKDPTENVFMSYAEWSERSEAMDAAIEDGQDHTKLDHYYFRLNGQGDVKNPYLYDEFPVFDPTVWKEGENLFLLHPDQARGINCRFGMSGNVAESHFDYSSNWIALLGGRRRYILSHPQECKNLALFPPGHPSGRHSSVDWSLVIAGDKAPNEAHYALAEARSTQVILQASDALFLPTNWLHFIVSLDRNYQCNARSGVRTHYNSYMADCGFVM